MNGVDDRSQALGAAGGWIVDLMQSNLVVAIAALAVAGIAFAMLLGRVPIRKAAATIFGCFIFFGATTIAQALLGSATPPPTEPAASPALPTTGPTELDAKPADPPTDPYAGASVPTR